MAIIKGTLHRLHFCLRHLAFSIKNKSRGFLAFNRIIYSVEEGIEPGFGDSSFLWRRKNFPRYPISVSIMQDSRTFAEFFLPRISAEADPNPQC
jgi:hypothetical protein